MALLIIAAIFVLLGIGGNRYTLVDPVLGLSFSFSEPALMQAVDADSVGLYERRAGNVVEDSCVA